MTDLKNWGNNIFGHNILKMMSMNVATRAISSLFLNEYLHRRFWPTTSFHKIVWISCLMNTVPGLHTFLRWNGWTDSRRWSGNQTVLQLGRIFSTKCGCFSHIFGRLEMLPGCRCRGVLRHDSVAFLSLLLCSSLWSHLLVPTDEGGGWAEVKVLSACIFQWIRFSRLPFCPSCCYPESMCTVCSCPTYERHF